MYAKTLIPGTCPIPALMATTNQADTLWPQLLARGWIPFGNSLRAATGELHIDVNRLQLSARWTRGARRRRQSRLT